ncbi:MAG TPA: hypothetical protein VGR40_09025, partial [Candidatus Binatus sp.]|nr:hypothetical protein [Candidatus Binatus sp.]
DDAFVEIKQNVLSSPLDAADVLAFDVPHERARRCVFAYPCQLRNGDGMNHVAAANHLADNERAQRSNHGFDLGEFRHLSHSRMTLAAIPQLKTRRGASVLLQSSMHSEHNYPGESCCAGLGNVVFLVARE